MLKPRMFIDTSVIGGCFDDEFAFGSRRLLVEFEQRRAMAVVSSLTLEELATAPRRVRAVLAGLPREAVEYAMLDEEAARLAEVYMSDGLVGSGSLVDAQQVAIATLSKVDVIVSWNFRHIVNLRRIRLFTAANLRLGLRTPEIRSPLEVLSGEEEV
jgi:predicted nucleic acid-binding protein